MKKGFYFIIVNDRDKNGNVYDKPELCEGSYENYGKLFVHRGNDWNGWANAWKVSHREAGSNIASNRTLSEAREIAKKLQDIQLWDLKTHKALSDAVSDPLYEDQVVKIKKILNLRV